MGAPAQNAVRARALKSTRTIPSMDRPSPRRRKCVHSSPAWGGRPRTGHSVSYGLGSLKPPSHSPPWLLLLTGGIFWDPLCVPTRWSSDFHGEFDAGARLQPERA
jgi:hypothetical protein